MVEVKVPTVGESISEVQISKWLKKEGDWVGMNEDLVELETEKASVQVPSPVAGILKKIVRGAEEFAAVGDVLAHVEPSEKPASGGSEGGSSSSPTAAKASGSDSSDLRVMPAAKKLLEENQLQASQVSASGPGGRVLKEDVVRHLEANTKTSTAVSAEILPAATSRSAITQSTQISVGGPDRMEEVKPLSMIRRTIAARLVQAQQTAALLTTFNEVDMQPVMALRTKYRDMFQEKHGIKLGLMSFFAKASVEALRRYPAVNAEIRGNNIVYRHYYDIGVAIGGGKGLVVPVLRNVEKMSFADIERTIGDYSRKAMENRLLPEHLEGGTFTISNGGIYGSLLSTPIVNPPQSGILGLHSIQDRPVAREGQVVIRPMMYIALTYDHRIIDGREAVSCLRTIKEVLEDPARLFLEV
ncbi:MAG: Dihydrolipoyllysine-residue succinyltransferase component of 2-oxoglutarate dehydrogenase complex [Planctomycetota bacterium]|jgi:2-oxoglutarate dehydrogenase E2 component (dihydrolipoamide succinyltransferase)